jgi:hypothetical protein
MKISLAKTRKPRTTVHINSKIEKQLLAYAAAAGAAGVGLLAAAQSAEAKVVYTPLANVPIKNLTIDFNGDGVTDVSFKTSYTYHGAFEVAYPGAKQGVGIAMGSLNNQYGAAPLPWLTRIGPKLFWRSYRDGLITGVDGCHSTCFKVGPWLNEANKYLAVKFLISGETHYGWVRLTVGDVFTGFATGYAYETIANKPIIAGKTSGPDVVVRNVSAGSAPMKVPARWFQTLGALARGAGSVAIWRREDELTTA